MRRLLVRAASLAASTVFAAGAALSGQSSPDGIRAAVVLDNERVRVFKTTGASLEGVEHRAGVVVRLGDGPAQMPGAAYWAVDAGVRQEPRDADAGPLVIVEPKDVPAAAPPAKTAGSKPGGAPLVGMSFRTLFENEKVTVIRARMDVDAREGVHTHGSDTLVVHLSGGTIEDTANGATTVNRWKPGDIEFEGRGSSHSARNIGPAVDVVLVALKP